MSDDTVVFVQYSTDDPPTEEEAEEISNLFDDSRVALLPDSFDAITKDEVQDIIDQLKDLVE